MSNSLFCYNFYNLILFYIMLYFTFSFDLMSYKLDTYIAEQ